MAWEAGKGDRYRKVDQKAYADNWDKIFGKKQEKTAPQDTAEQSTSQDTEKK